ncbi:MAG: hypothetical protein WCJ29_03990 [bacterium]
MRFVDDFLGEDSPGWLKKYVAGFIAALAVFRFWNSWQFNPYWGYDGGGHIDYIFSLASGHLPNIATNYLAWHEPLYYLLLAPIAFLGRGLHTFGLIQACLSLGVAALSWLVIRELVQTSWARALTFTVWNLLPPVVLASTFVTNELLNYFWILLILLLALRFSGAPVVIPKPRDPVVFKWIPAFAGMTGVGGRAVYFIGIICGLALLTKITAIVAVFAVVIAQVFRGLSEQQGTVPWSARWRQPVIIALIAILMYAPWLAVRTKYVLPSLSINNTSYMAPAPLALDNRIWFFAKFDSDIFKFPYWYSGGRGFWSMIYADTFWDYYGMMQNRNQLASTPASLKISTDRNGGEVLRANLVVARTFPYLAIPLALIMLIGAFELLKKPFEMPTLVSFGLFAALLYFSYRYPFYDRGIVKSIFIGPAYLPILAAGFGVVEARLKSTWGKLAITIMIFAYVAMLLRVIIMPSLGY